MTLISLDTAAPVTGPAAVTLDSVVKRFGAVTAVDRLDLRIRPGEVVALLGPNGAGKTTTIDMLLGLSRPDAGTVRVYGRPPQEAVARGLVSAVMQSGGLLKDYTVAETVRVIAVLFGSSRAEASAALERAGIADIGDRLVGRCSGGQQQRLRFAMALLPDPELLILDEPTTGMDVGGRHEFWSAIRKDAQDGRTVVFATAGAGGFVVKDTPARQLADAVRRMHQGLRVVDPALAAQSLAQGDSPLTERETDVLRAAQDGGTVADIARELGLSEGTIRNHLSAAIGKTGARTRAEAVRLAVDNGWLLT